MEGVYYRQLLGEGINFYLIREPKFKTVSVNIIIYRTLDENTTDNALLPYILKRGNKEFTDTPDIERFLGQRYGASLNADILKKGDMQLIYIGGSVISDKYTIKGEGVVADILNFLIGLIERPLIGEEGFKKEYFEQERDNLCRLINARINDKIQYSIDRCHEETTKGQPFSRYRYGDVGRLGELTPLGLAKYFKNMMAEAPIDLFVVGDVDIADLKSFLDKPLTFSRGAVKYPGQAVSSQWAGEPKKVIEPMDVNQGKITIDYTTGINYTHSQYVPMLVYTSILGGGAHSKLFNNVREKASLAYYSFARLESFKGLMVIGAGIDMANYGKALSIIGEQIEQMKNGQISDEEIMAAKKALINEVRAIQDSQMHIIDFLLNRIVSGHMMTPEMLIESIDQVTRGDIVDVAEHVKHAVTYFLTDNGKTGEE